VFAQRRAAPLAGGDAAGATPGPRAPGNCVRCKCQRGGVARFDLQRRLGCRACASRVPRKQLLGLLQVGFDQHGLGRRRAKPASHGIPKHTDGAVEFALAKQECGVLQVAPLIAVLAFPRQVAVAHLAIGHGTPRQRISREFADETAPIPLALDGAQGVGRTGVVGRERQRFEVGLRRDIELAPAHRRLPPRHPVADCRAGLQLGLERCRGSCRRRSSCAAASAAGRRSRCRPG
jgi:hypothetical protein